MRSVAVTGARGLIGELIVNNLFDAGWKVKVLTRSDRKYFSPKITGYFSTNIINVIYHVITIIHIIYEYGVL